MTLEDLMPRWAGLAHEGVELVPRQQITDAALEWPDIPPGTTISQVVLARTEDGPPLEVADLWPGSGPFPAGRERFGPGGGAFRLTFDRSKL